MGCKCTEPTKKPSSLDILKDGGEPGGENSVKWNSSTKASPHVKSIQVEPPDSIPPNEQTPNEQKLENSSVEKVSFTNCDTPVRNQEIKSASQISKKYPVDCVAELSDWSLAKSRQTNGLIANTTSDNHDISLVIQAEVTMEWCIPEDGRSPMIEPDRVVLSAVSLPALESAEISTVELREVRKELDQMESRNKEMDEEIKTLKEENCKLKENAQAKARRFSHRNYDLKEKATTMRKRREKIRESTIFTTKMVSLIDRAPSDESHEVDMESSFESLPDLHALKLQEKEKSLQFRSTPRESRKTENPAVPSNNWTFTETVLIE